MSPSPGPNRVRLANWLMLEYLLDVISIASAGRHPMDSLLLASISQANVAHITAAPDLHRAYADADAPPPDELRRPISTHALAQSLRAPFETVRRRVRALEKLGLCVTINGGLVVPSAAVSTPAFLANVLRAYERVRRLYRDLERYGLLPELPAPAVALPPGTAPVRAVSRTTTDFNLRMADLAIQAAGDNLLDALILLGALHGNLAHVAPQAGGLSPWRGEDFVREHRRPAPAGRIGAALGLPTETVRRRAHGMQAAGLCTVTPRGLIVSERVLRGRHTRQIMASNLANLDRMLNLLAQAGVIALWRVEGLAQDRALGAVSALET